MQPGRHSRRTAVFALAAAFLFAARAASAAVNPGLTWKTISTEHFDVHFHEGEEWTAQQVAKIAEEIYGPITGVYHYQPRRCHFVILDTQDYANGAAFYYDNKVEIWATNLEFNLRGTTQWLRNVVTHEYTHIVSIQAAMKMPLRIPAIYLQGVGFESEKRPDVINGYPDAIVSYPITGTVVPAWWAEGVAQYQSPGKQTDCWDTHRDMILRAARVEDKMLTYDEMAFLGHRSLGNEQVYDHGYGLVRFIASAYGPDAIERINAHLGDWNRLSMDGALKKVTGKSGEQLYQDWRVALKERYDRMLVPVYSSQREGTVLFDKGFMTLGPSFSPDGRVVAFLSNQGSDYAATALYTIARDGKNLTRVTGGVTSRPFFSPDGKRLVYAKHERADVYGSELSDVFIYDLAAKKETRVTRRARAAEPSWSPDGAHIVCVLNGDGTHRLATIDPDGRNFRVIHAREKGVQFYAPQYAPDGARILFGVFDTGTRDLASVMADGSDFRYELRSNNDERDARFTRDGRAIVFASDRSGIFDVYRMDLASGDLVQLTNVVGGAFMPDLASDGTLVYAQYTAGGYRVSRLDTGSAPVDSIKAGDYARRTAGEFDKCAALKARPDVVAAPAEPVTEEVDATTPADTTLAAHSPGDGAQNPPALPDSAALRATDIGGPMVAPDSTGIGAAAPLSGTATPTGGPAPPSLASAPYKWDYTGFQFYPRAILWDGTPRLGLFVASNEILDRQSLFFGGSYGTNGEFDAIVNFELRRLYPVIFMQYFQVREKYSDQFPIEDLGRYYYIDYRYDVWSADLGLRFELEDIYSLTHRNDVSLWWNHSEYKIHGDPAFTPIEDPGAVRVPDGNFGWKYFYGNEAHARWYYKKIKRSTDSDINPRHGRELNLEVMRADENLFTSGEFDYGNKPKYTKFRFGQYTIDYKEYVALPAWQHTLQVRLMASIIDKRVDDFFWVYMGGMDRLRGYTYYAIGGRKGALASATYRFPILRRVNRQASWLTMKDLYGGVFYEAASAWNSVAPWDSDYNGKEYYSSAGGELRLNLGSFYNYPTAVNFTAAYALDKAVYRNPILSVPEVRYDPQWRYYIVVGFTF